MLSFFSLTLAFLHVIHVVKNPTSRPLLFPPVDLQRKSKCELSWRRTWREKIE